MKYLFWILMIFTAAVAVTIASHNHAYVLFLYPPYRIGLSLTLFVSLLLLTFILGYGLVRFISTTLQLPVYVRNFRESRTRNKGRAMLEESLHAFFEGRYATAEKSAATAIAQGETDPLYPILAARAAHELRQYAKRDAYLSTADDTNVMRLMAAAEFMLDQRQPQSALNVLQTLRDSGVKNHAGALKLELKAHQQAGNWADVLGVLAQLEKRVAVDVTTATLIRQQAYLDSITQQHDIRELTEHLKTIPLPFQRRSKIAAAAARALIKFGGCALTATLIADSLNETWDSDLIELYGECQSGEVLAQIEQAELWLKQHQDDAALLLTLGRLCSYQKLWGKAKTYLDASISIRPSAAGYHALAQLAERLGEAAFPYYQQAMKLSNCA